MFNITTEQMRFWSPEVRELEPYVPGEQPKIQNLLKLNTNENPYPTLTKSGGGCSSSLGKLGRCIAFISRSRCYLS